MGQGFVRLTFQFEREGSDWVGTCVELGTSTFGRSRRGVQQALTEMVTELIEVMEEDGTRERIFRERGVEVEEGAVPATVQQEVHAVPVRVAVGVAV